LAGIGDLVGGKTITSQPTATSAAPMLVKADQARSPCPFCAEMILDAAVVCRFCGRDLPADWARGNGRDCRSTGKEPAPAIRYYWQLARQSCANCHVIGDTTTETIQQGPLISMQSRKAG
jgi:hypothetical protein